MVCHMLPHGLQQECAWGQRNAQNDWGLFARFVGGFYGVAHLGSVRHNALFVAGNGHPRSRGNALQEFAKIVNCRCHVAITYCYTRRKGDASGAPAQPLPNPDYNAGVESIVR